MSIMMFHQIWKTQDILFYCYRLTAHPYMHVILILYSVTKLFLLCYICVDHDVESVPDNLKLTSHDPQVHGRLICWIIDMC